MDSKSLILLICAGGTFVLLSASVGGNDWFSKPFGTSEGLWKNCGFNMCVDIGFDVNSKFQAIRAFALLGVLAAAGGALVSLFRLFKDMDAKIVSIFFLVAGICMLISLAIYTNHMSGIEEYPGYDWGWSYILGWIGVVLSFVMTGLAVFLK